VSPAVIDRLEVVDVDEQDGKFALAASGHGELHDQAFFEGAAVAETSEFVGDSEAAKLVVGVLQLAMVALELGLLGHVLCDVNSNACKGSMLPSES